ETTEATEKGFLNTTAYSTFNCKAVSPTAQCKVKNTRGEETEGVYATAYGPPVIVPGPFANETGVSSLPWTGELIEREEGRRQVLTHKMEIWIVLPPIGEGAGCVGGQIPFEAREGKTEKEAGYEFAPIWVNGAKNGLKPSHEEFLAETGLTEKEFPITGRLTSPNA